MLATARALKDKGVDESRIKTELFGTPSADLTTSGPRPAPRQGPFLQSTSRSAVVCQQELQLPSIDRSRGAESGHMAGLGGRDADETEVTELQHVQRLGKAADIGTAGRQPGGAVRLRYTRLTLSLIHISEPTRPY